MLNRMWETTEKMEKVYRVEQARPERLNIHLASHQEIAKRFISQTVEEYVEFLETILNEHSIDHIEDEIADTMNMATSLAIMSGLNPSDIEGLYSPDFDNLEDATTRIVYAWFMVANILKLRPWKRDGVLTDVNVYKSALINAYVITYQFFMEYGDLATMMEKKNETNEFRLKSNY